MPNASLAGNSPSISVITIVRNGKQFIEQTIKSVLEQSYANVEYIVIDGGSTDGTIDIIGSYASRIADWLSEEDEGIADAFNKGLSRATGDYILFLNSDDALADSNVLAGVAAEITKCGFPILIYGDCDVLERGSDKILYRASIELSHEGLKRGQMLPQPSLFAHQSYFRKYGVFNGRFKIAMDFEWLLRGGMQERIVHMPHLVTRVRDGGISTRNQARVVDEIILALKMNKFVSSRWAELQLRGYFFGRAMAKSVLTGIGLYRVFDSWRNRFANRGRGVSASSERD